ncbi:hypothetical protein SCLARK_00506 [Spiroplasma clarkii]|uniref:hypothetical protein n=1 Tax=Spiroplasma clarkii TaxID=2139 RepID=UPI000B55D5E4|nr:hypothetical protein [Spiroplasma clarkii]ARU91200.1 hypothetical protein SCLARK_00506 [Spiroplasma clarkii]
MAQSYGADLGSDLFKVILDKDYSGFNDHQKWFDNMNGGFLLEGITKKVKPFSEWGTIGDTPVSMKVLKNKVVEQDLKSAEINVSSIYQCETEANVYYYLEVYLKFKIFPKLFPITWKFGGILEEEKYQTIIVFIYGLTVSCKKFILRLIQTELIWIIRSLQLLSFLMKRVI